MQKSRNIKKAFTQNADLLFLAFLTLLTLTTGLSLDGSSVDDAYITYRYARNISEGKGFVYNPGEAVLGTTTPLYTLLLAIVGLFYGDFPLTSHVIGVVSWAFCVILACLIGRTLNQRKAGLASAALIATNPLLPLTLGMETCFYMAVFLAVLYFYFAGHLDWSAALLAVLVLTRGDGILLAMVILADYLVRHRHFPLRQVILFGLIVSPWFLYSLVTFGSIFPNSLTAKMGQVYRIREGDATPFLSGLVILVRQFLHHSKLYYALIPLWTIGLLGIVGWNRHWLLLLAWMFLYLMGYIALGVVNFHWYYAPLAVGLLLLAGIGAEVTLSIPKRLSKFELQKSFGLLLTPAVILCLIAVLVAQWQSLTIVRRELPWPRIQSYKAVGDWLRENTKEDSSVATIEIGAIGYYSRRTIIDTMGLITPDVARHIYGWWQTVVYSLLRHSPDYAIAWGRGTAWDGIRYQEWFQEMYEPVKVIHNSRDVISPVTIYERKPSPFTYAIQREVEFIVGGKVRLNKYELERTSIKPGEDLHLALHWQGLEKMAEDYKVVVYLANSRTGQGWGQQVGDPMHGGNPTTLWQAGERVKDEHIITAPMDIPPGKYQITIGLYSLATDELLPVFDGAGNLLGDTIALVPIKVPLAAGVEYAIQEPLQVNLGNQVTLLGYDLTPLMVKPGEPLHLTLYWQARKKMEKDYTVFTHLLDEKEQVWAQKDNQPLGDDYPTSIWGAGEVIKDDYELLVEADAPTGEYQIEVGMYELVTGQRLSILDEDGQPQGDRVLVHNIVVHR